ncbi:aminoglycoside phosphotransferase family protein [Myceligenerans salitolerans]|uniref:Phosphotransferase n=1 Tax=Myceligenerans salitolerans TaxID=1230528 RepID=A0ABS3ICH2_9MICO|nr:aminoglycoside phosphotransferase family protein [Myceligenerans salitolerans]MBO0610698.1 phosphotransferase [Myceligenerans salitolerans]
MSPVPAGCARRLRHHYGSAVDTWIAHVPRQIDDACREWGLRFVSYHDHGHASAIAVVHDAAGTPRIVKAWPETARFRAETAALTHWYDAGVVLATITESSIALLRMIGGQPGGHPVPAGHESGVATAIRDLHARPLRAGNPSTYLQLSQYLTDTVRPRIARRMESPLACPLATRVYNALARGLPASMRGPTLLHGDLYRENALFDQRGVPLLVDPLPMIGDPIFDWAFWVVYYDLRARTEERLALAETASQIDRHHILFWCLMLCLDGLLYFRETQDSRATTMAEVLERILTLRLVAA